MPTYQKPEDLLTERYVKECFEEMGYEVWWYNDPDDPKPSPHRGDMTVLDLYPGTPRKLKRPYVPVEVKRRDMDWGAFPDVILDVDKVLDMRRWSDNHKRVRDNHRIKLADPSGRYSALAHEPPKGPVMFVVVPNDLTLRKVWIGHDRIGEWKVSEQPPRAGRTGSHQVLHIPTSHFTTWHPPEDIKADYMLAYA